MPILYLNDDDQTGMLAWAAPRAFNEGTWPARAHALGVYEETGTLRAVLVTVETYAGIIDCHFASDGSRTWATRNILRGLFGYVFEVRKAFRIQTVSPVTNKPIIRTDLALGWNLEATLKDGIEPGVDGLLFSMTPGNCPWIKEENHG